VGMDATGVPSVTISYLISNSFRLTSPLAANHAGTIRLRFSVPDAGQLVALATAKVPANQHRAKRRAAYTITYGGDTVSTSGTGTVTITIKPSKTVKRLLSVGARLTVTSDITFTPTGGTSRTRTIHGVVNAKPKPRHR
jgi:hypothetical protein